MSNVTVGSATTLRVGQTIKVASVLDGRYPPGTKPVSWDNRFPGWERVVSENGEEFLLASLGGQSTPAPGWELLLTKPALAADGISAYEWTLYGVSPVS